LFDEAGFPYRFMLYAAATYYSVVVRGPR